MNIGYELLSISLEVVAFFCVTIDLYGQSRLDTASKKLGSVMDSALRWVTPATSAWVEEIDSTLKVKNTYFQIRRFFLIVGGTVLYLLIMYFMFNYLRASNGPEADFLGAFFALFIGLYAIFAFFLIPYAVLYTVGIMTVFGQWLLERVRFSGILLACGSLLFVIAKGILWCDLLSQWIGGKG